MFIVADLTFLEIFLPPFAQYFLVEKTLGVLGGVKGHPRDNWDKVFKSGPSKICGRQPLKKSVLGRPYPFKFFKGCLPQILLGPLLNTLSQLFHNRR